MRQSRCVIVARKEEKNKLEYSYADRATIYVSKYVTRVIFLLKNYCDFLNLHIFLFRAYSSTATNNLINKF